MKWGNLVMRKVESFKIGDIVAFENPQYNYVIEDIYITKIGKICHVFNDETGTSCYQPGEILYAPEKR